MCSTWGEHERNAFILMAHFLFCEAGRQLGEFYVAVCVMKIPDYV